MTVRTQQRASKPPIGKKPSGKRVVKRLRIPPGPKLRTFHVGQGVESLSAMREELDGYIDVLMGRKVPPSGSGVESLMEYATAVYGRAQELNIKLSRAETEGYVLRGSKHYRFRTTELRHFLEMAKAAIELGNRRITLALKEVDGY